MIRLSSSAVKRRGRPALGRSPQPINAFCIEAVESAVNGLRATIKRLRNRFYPLAIPAAGHDLGVNNPVGRSMPTPSHLRTYRSSFSS